MIVRPYEVADLKALREIWNAVVDEGQAFPQEKPLNKEEAREFFASQSLTLVAVSDETSSSENAICGLAIIHPNNVGRCGHIANASYAVAPNCRGQGVGRALVTESLRSLAPLGFRGLQFNAVVATNMSAIHLYEDLGFRRIGVIPGGFRNKQGALVDIIIYYHEAPK